MARAGELDLDLAYVPAEDRLRLTLRTASRRSDWWLTRRITLRLVEAWVGKLDEVPLPAVPVSAWVPGPASRDLSQEHGLSLEFDGPRRNPTAPATSPPGVLATQLTLTVTGIDCRLDLAAEGATSGVILTRREAHGVLEMIAAKARQAGWLATPAWPEWLGRTV